MCVCVGGGGGGGGGGIEHKERLRREQGKEGRAGKKELSSI